jgi:hypothetical protein
MNYKSEKILIIGEAQRSRPDTPQLAAGRVHFLPENSGTYLTKPVHLNFYSACPVKFIEDKEACPIKSCRAI